MKKALMVLMIIFTGFVDLQSAPGQESPSDYYSLHQEQVTGIHCTSGACATGENCAFSDNCPADKPYLRNVSRVGYKAINELRDDYFAIGSTISLPAVACTNQAGIAAGKSRRFRVYVPPGATELDLTLFCTQDPVAVVARWKKAPDAEHVDAIGSLVPYIWTSVTKNKKIRQPFSKDFR